MNTEDVRAILTICLMASYADGEKHDREREQIREVAESLTKDHQVNLPGLYQDVLLRKVTLTDVASRLTTQEARQLAYEMAVCVCEADGQTSDKEKAFLHQLKATLGQDDTSVESQIDALAQAPLQQATPIAQDAIVTHAPAPHPASVDLLANEQPEVRAGKLSPDEMDRKILNAAIINGAIELLPENLSTLAIIPLQMRLVYQIGENYGYTLDRGHIKDLLTALGVGLTSQYLEQAGRKLLSGLLGKGILGGLGRQAVSSGMSFASTYALGHVANQYYAGGRQLSMQMLRDAYDHVMADGRQLQTRYLPQMQQMAQQLNTAKVLQMVRGG